MKLFSGKRKVSALTVLMAVLLVVALAALCFVLFAGDLFGSDTSDYTDNISVRATPEAGDADGDGPEPVATAEPTATPPPTYDSGDTGLFNDFKEPADRFLAALEPSDGKTETGLQITGPLSYRNNSVRKSFAIIAPTGPDGCFNLAECDEYTRILAVNYEEEYFNDGYCYGMYFDDPQGMLAPGEYRINDDWFEHLIIREVPDSTYRLMVFKCRVRMVFTTVARNSAGHTIISAYERPSPGERVVFIDPHYGGIVDQGGWRSNIAVCDLNLNIARRVSKLLTDSGVRVYMSRDRDEYVGLWERNYLAQSVGADMYISITFGNNQADLGAKGTTAMYDSAQDGLDADITGRVLAQALQTRVTEACGTGDNGISAMGIAPFRACGIPAVTLRIGYISNDDDFFSIIKEEFKDEAAAAIRDAVLDVYGGQTE